MFRFQSSKEMNKSKLPLIGLQTTKAFPVNPLLHEHIGIWFTTWQIAFTPQVPIQGSTHFCCTQAFLRSQSVLKTHSGRQLKYGSP